MKKVIITLLSILLMGLGFNFTKATPAEDSGIEEIVIESKNDPGDERGAAPVEAFFLHASNSIYLTFANSIGTASVIVRDASGVQVYSTVVDTTLVGFTLFASPIAPGSYTLEIQSPNYFGVGVFVI
ncbi:MAG: DUF3244 domain-containing protein [Bacteroidales bacterium]|nr:DUF3244 domain-containing protein [Bacteroidales bacterium]